MNKRNFLTKLFGLVGITILSKFLTKNQTPVEGLYNQYYKFKIVNCYGHLEDRVVIPLLFKR